MGRDTGSDRQQSGCRALNKMFKDFRSVGRIATKKSSHPLHIHPARLRQLPPLRPSGKGEPLSAARLQTRQEVIIKRFGLKRFGTYLIFSTTQNDGGGGSAALRATAVSALRAVGVLVFFQCLTHCHSH